MIEEIQFLSKDDLHKGHIQVRKNNRIIMIEYQLPLRFIKYSKCLSYPHPLHATQRINPFLDSMIVANHDKFEGFQPIVKS